MKTLKMWLMAGVCLFALPAFFQPNVSSVKGTVTDAKTGESVPFANVVLKDDSGNIIKGGVTDFDGKYNLSPVLAGIYDIEVSFQGYSTVKQKGIEVSAVGTTFIDFQMQEATQELQEVTIHYSAPLIDRDKSSTTTTSESFTNMAVRNVSAVLTQMPGVTQDANRYVIRGARSEGTLNIVDGVKMRGASNVPQSAVSQTEVITGGVPAQYSGEVNRHDVAEIEVEQVAYTPPPQPQYYPEPNTESYAPIIEIPFEKAELAPLSTFSSDVDAASYANLRRFINSGTMPPPDAVRIEEMINYFEYDYPDPEEGRTFSVTTEAGACDWADNHKLLRIGIKTQSIPIEELPPNNLVFLIDVSGSMDYHNKLPLLQESLKLMVDQLREEDRVAIVVYASSTGLVLKPTSGDKKNEIKRAIDRLRAGGSTAGGAGIQLAYKTAQKYFLKKGNNRVILATDGDFNVGISSEDGLKKLIEEKREEGVFLSVLGFGMGNYQDSKMEKLADNGNGNYAYIDNLMEAQKVLVSELGANLNVVAKDTKFQIEFNPNKVFAYRLIGYENRILNDEDFNDDTKDAGDIGSGHNVTALYEIVPRGGGAESGILNIDSLKYGKIKSGDDQFLDEWATVKIRHKKPGETESILEVHAIKIGDDAQSADFMFVSAILEFGMILRGSNYRGNSTYDKVLALAKRGTGNDTEGYRHEFIRMVKLAKRLDNRDLAMID